MSGTAFSKLSASRLWLAFVFGLTSLLAPALAEATISVRSISHGSTVGSVAYYSSSVAIPAGFADSTVAVDPEYSYKFSLVDVSATQASDTLRTNMLRFAVQSSTELTSSTGKSFVLVVKASVANSTARQVPIAYLSNEKCEVGRCSLQGSFVSSDFFFAVPYTSKSEIEIGLYIADICSVAYSQAGTASGDCGAAGGTVAPTGTDPANIYLTFEIWEFQGTTTPVSTPDTGSLELRFQGSTPGVSCGFSTTSNSLNYFPGDSEIKLETSKITQPVTSLAPVSQVVVVGKKNNGPVDVTSAFASGTNDLVSRVSLGGSQSVTGFTNVSSTGDTTNTYEVEAMIRDASGLMSVNSGTCRFENVQTASIRGFLEKGECFIATAAFRDPDHPSVRLLREFRDRVLRKTGPGRDFVNWYYAWSPPAAEWLLKNDEYRFPVLLLLAPLQAIAWMTLNPASLLLVIPLFSSLLLLGYRRISRRMA